MTLSSVKDWARRFAAGSTNSKGGVSLNFEALRSWGKLFTITARTDLVRIFRQITFCYAF
jgi:hypothetical protein